MSNAARADALGCERGHIGSRLDSATFYDRVNAETRQGLPTAIEEYPFLRWTLASEVAQPWTVSGHSGHWRCLRPLGTNGDKLQEVLRAHGEAAEKNHTTYRDPRNRAPMPVWQVIDRKANDLAQHDSVHKLYTWSHVAGYPWKIKFKYSNRFDKVLLSSIATNGVLEIEGGNDPIAPRCSIWGAARLPVTGQRIFPVWPSE